MDEKTALHTAARRYCLEHEPGLTSDVRERLQYGILLHLYDPEYAWPEEDAAVVAAAAIMSLLLRKIEFGEPRSFVNIDALRSFLLQAGVDVIEELTSADNVGEDLDQIEAYSRYVEGLSSTALRAVVPLPYRRYISGEEADIVWQRLEDRWGASPDQGWFPILPPDSFQQRSDVVAFDQLVFYWHVDWSSLRAILAANGVEEVYELTREREDNHCVMAVQLVEIPVVGLSEMFLTDTDANWTIYVSHEQSVTVAGKHLVGAIERFWPTWEAGLSVLQTGVWPEELSERLNF